MWSTEDSIEEIEDIHNHSGIGLLEVPLQGMHLNQDLDVSFYCTTTTEPLPLKAENYFKRKDSGYCSNSVNSIGPRASFESTDSVDETFFDNFNIAATKETACSLPDFNILINGSLKPDTKVQEAAVGQDFPIRSICKRSCVEITTPTSTSSRNKLKRLLSEEDISKNKCKKFNNSLYTFTSEANIEFALEKSSTDPNLIGDCSRNYSLPLISGRHQDLKSISSITVALLMQGHFADKIVEYKIIDCRFPYEFSGGHIKGAINLFTKRQISQHFLNSNIINSNPLDSQPVLIFHCEFSSSRAPNLYRYLRNTDRLYNEKLYPALYYPEIYLLEGGYKDFYTQFNNLCEPDCYVAMSDPKYSKQLLYFKEKSKNTIIDRNITTSQGSLKRLQFN